MRRIHILLIFIIIISMLISCKKANTCDESYMPIPVLKQDKYGFINCRGSFVIKPKFNAAKRFSEGLSAVKVDNKWGYIDIKGNMVIKPIFFDAGSFSEGLAAVEVEKVYYNGKTDLKWGYINRTGKMVVRPQFDSAEKFSEGLAKVDDHFIDKAGKKIYRKFDPSSFILADMIMVENIKGKIGFINNKGEFIIKHQFDSVSEFSEGLARVKVKGKYGFIDKKGKIVINPRFDYATDFHYGIASTIIKIEGIPKSIHIDKAGNTIKNLKKFIKTINMSTINEFQFLVPPPPPPPPPAKRFSRKRKKKDRSRLFEKQPFIKLNRTNQYVSSMGSFSGGLSRIGFKVSFIKSNGEYKKYGFMDKKGKIIIKPQFDDAFDFSEGLAGVKGGEMFGGKFGFIDNTGNMAINAEFDLVREFSEGLAGVCVNGKWGFINKKGEIVIKPFFSDIYNFSEGISGVRIDGKWGFINKKGEIVIKPQFNKLYQRLFQEGLIEVKFGEKCGFINKNGDMVFLRKERDKKNGNFSKTVSMQKKHNVLNPEDPKKYFYLAHYFQKKGMWDLSIESHKLRIEYLGQSLDLKNNKDKEKMALACNWLGFIYWMKSYRTITDLMPVQERIQIIKKGMAVLEKAIDMAPDYPDTYRNISLLYRERIKCEPLKRNELYDNARKYLNRYIELRKKRKEREALLRKLEREAE